MKTKLSLYVQMEIGETVAHKNVGNSSKRRLGKQ